MAKDLVTKGTKDSLTKDPVNHVATEEVAQVTKGRSGGAKRTKFWCEVMNFRESTELWLTGLNVKHVQCETMLMTMVVTQHVICFFSF